MAEPKILELAPQPALVVRCTAGADEIAAVMARRLADVRACANECGAVVSGAPFTRILRFEDDGRLEIEVGLPVLEETAGSGPVEYVELPGGRCVTLVHEGPYGRLALAHLALDVWLESEGWLPVSPRWVSYLAGPAEQTRPEEWRTVLAQPVAGPNGC